MSADPVTRIAAYRRGDLFFDANMTANFVPYLDVLPRWKADIVKPAAPGHLESLLRLVENGMKDDRDLPAIILTESQAKDAAVIALTDPKLDLCPGMFPHRAGWLLFANIIEVSQLAVPGQEDQIHGRGCFIPLPIRAIKWVWYDDTTVVVNMFPAERGGRIRSEAWSARGCGEQHCAILDQAGGGRFLAACLAVLDMHGFKANEPTADDDDECDDEGDETGV